MDDRDPFGPMTFSTEDVPAKERLGILREVIGRTIAKLDIETADRERLRVDMSLRALPGLGIAQARTCTAMTTRRTRELLAEGSEDVVLEIARSGSITVSQLGREITYAHGTTLISNAEPKTSVCSPGADVLAVTMPAAVLAPMLADPGAVLMSVLPLGSGPLQLLVDYLDSVMRDAVLATPELLRLIVSHVHDLAALALGATPDAAEIARDRGVRAARLAAIKADIRNNIGRRRLSIEDVALRQGISPSYVRKLLEEEGTTFTAFVLSQRLAGAYRMLADGRHAGRAIGIIAFECGFSDLSYFNRTFRRAFGATPSEVRRAASEGERRGG